jgi:hypothetical protein
MHEAPGDGEVNRHDATHRKGCQMRYKATFAAGFVVGFIVGARAGRERYDQIVKFSRQVAEHPAVQKATNTVTTKATELGKTAAAKAPDIAKTAATTVGQQVPKMAATAKQKASDRLPFGGKSDTSDTEDEPLAYPNDNGQSSVNGVRYTTTDGS